VQRQGKFVLQRRAIVAAVVIALLLGLGYGVNRASAEWAPVVRLLLPLAVGLLATFAGRGPALVGMILALAFLFPGLIEALAGGQIAPIAYELAVAGLCLVGGALLPTFAVRQLRETSEASLAHRMEELAVLEEVARTVTGSLDLEATLRAILTSVRRLIAFDMGEITLWDPEGERLVSYGSLDAEAYHAEAGRVYRLEEGYSGWLARNRRPLLIRDIQARRDVRPKLDRPDSPFRSYVGVPLESKGTFVGTLELISCRPDAFSERDLEILQAVGLQAAAAIENAQLYTRVERELERRAVALSGLQRIARELSLTFDLERILRLVMEEALRLSEADRCAVLLRDLDTGEWRIGICAGYLEEEQAALRRALVHPPEESALQEAMQGRRAVRVADAEAEGRTVRGEGRVRSGLLTPVCLGDELVGLILLESDRPRAFDEEAQEFVEGLAAQAAVAVGNAQRFQEQIDHSNLLRRRADQLSHVLEIGRAIRSDRPLEEVLEEIAYAVQESVGFDLALISVLEGHPPMLRRVAAAGLPRDVVERMKRTPQPWHALEVVMQDEFRISQSYYIPAEEQARWRGVLDVYDQRIEEVHREPGRWHPQDMLIVPLLGPGGEIRGILSVDEPRDGRVPDLATVEALEVFAAQAAVAVENARLVEALQRRLDLLTFFNELNRSVTAKRDLGEVLQTVVEATAHLVQCTGTVLFLLDEETGRYVPQAAYGHDLQALRARSYGPGEGLVGKAVATGMPVSVGDVAEEVDGKQGYIQAGSVVLVPLGFGDQVVGVLAADRAYREPFSSVDVATLTALADQVAVAVQNARLYDEAVRRTWELSTLLEGSRAISSTLDLNWVFQALGDRLLTATEAEGCVISEWDRDTDRLTVVWEIGREGVDRSRIGTTCVAAERHDAAEVLLTQEPLILHPADMEAVGGAGQGGDVLLLPMVARGQTVGLVELVQHDEGAFTPERVRLAQALANQAAVAMQNARLYEEVRRFSKELERRVEERTEELARALEELTVERDRVETLYRIASEVSTSLDLDHVLNRTLELTVQAVGAERGAILLRDPERDQLIYRAAWGTLTAIPPGGHPVRWRRGEGLAWWIIEHNQSALVEDLREDERWLPGEEEPVHRACLAVPIGRAGDVQGVLLLYHSRPGFFNADHLRLVEAAAYQISNAVGNTALYNLIREQAEQLGAMLKRQQVEAAKSKAILEGVADGVMVTDARGRVILFNAAAERVLEIPREKVLGRTTREMLGLYGAEGRAWLDAIEEWAANPADHIPGDFTAERVQLGDRVVSVHVSPVIMGTEYLGTVSVFRDVTAEVEAERAKSEFVSTVSHELRTPMTSIKGYTDLLLMGAVGELTEQQRHFVTIIRNNADRLTALVSDLLDISRIESGRVELDLRAVPIHEVVEQVVGSLQPRAQSRDLTMEVHVDKDLPAVWGDSDRIAQILTNLVGNAIQYTPPGGKITVSAQVRADEMMEVSVADTGIGIAREDQEKIFDRFFRADDPFVQETPGTGLGLPITASLVAMHGGEIWVESELGEGSTFTFTLPLARAMRAAAAPPVATSPLILVVEDDADVANLIRFQLETAGFEVTVAASGTEALQLARELEPALITLDLRLPDINGLVVLQHLKEDPATTRIPVVIVSIVSSVEEGLRLGAVGYVTKPFDEEALLSAVRRGLGRRGPVLVVDDDSDTLRLIREALRRHGLGVRTTRRGRQALHVARQVHPALVLLDLKLADMDGYQVLRGLKSNPLTRDIPVLVMTGSPGRIERGREALTLGAARFLTKPFAVEELVQEIVNLLGDSQGNGGRRS